MDRLDTSTLARRLTGVLLGALLLAGLLAPAAAAAAGRLPVPTTPAGLSAMLRSLPRIPGQGVQLAPRAGDCMSFEVIECGQTLQGDITTQDCQLDTGEYVDFVFFDGVKGETITATLSSTDFNPALFLFEPDTVNFTFDDDSGPGNSAQIVEDINQTSPNWSLVPTPLEAGVTGSYTLTLQCQNTGGGGGGGGNPPPDDGFFSDPQYPDFRFKVEIEPTGGTAIDGTHLTECQEDTVCVAGAVADRPEVYIRILGPRPNGYLWPTLVRFTPSKVTVQIKQVSTGEMQTYTLDAVPAGTDDLPGLQDRMGFLP